MTSSSVGAVSDRAGIAGAPHVRDRTYAVGSEIDGGKAALADFLLAGEIPNLYLRFRHCIPGARRSRCGRCHDGGSVGGPQSTERREIDVLLRSDKVDYQARTDMCEGPRSASSRKQCLTQSSEA